jgi:cytochrome c-type biogenesis protein CcmH
MSGWIVLGLLFVAALGALRLLGLRGPLLQLAAAALLFGCAGYALQGHPVLAGSPREAQRMAPPIPLTQIRHGFFGDFGPTEHWLIMSESFAKRGDTEKAVGILQAAVREHPRDAQLWIGLGNALVDHAGVLTPASEFAFRRAAELAPGHPAPLFFLGLALARSGDGQGALVVWKTLLANAPADAPWRPLVEDAVAALSGGPAPTAR